MNNTCFLLILVRVWTFFKLFFDILGPYERTRGRNYILRYYFLISDRSAHTGDLNFTILNKFFVLPGNFGSFSLSGRSEVFSVT